MANMKRIFFLLIIIFASTSGFAQYKPVEQGSSVQFTIGNFGFDVNGSFKGVRGAISFDPQN